VLRIEETAEGEEGSKPTMVDAKLLEPVCADAEGNDFYAKYAKGRQESKRQSIRLSIIGGANQNWFY
jgi:hypothetical protein